MRLSRAAITVCLALAAASAGCIENMGDLKEALGVVDPPPVYAAPLAKARADESSVLAGAPVRFVGEESRDPQGLALLYAWDFGAAGTAEGPAVVRAFDAPGEYVVRLKVTNEAGLADEDTVTIRVAPLDAPPVVALRLTDGAGRVSARTLAGEPLTFESRASDPEGKALVLEWDFGDGASAGGSKATHAYARPGIYVATLHAADPGGQGASASATVTVDGAWTESGAFEAAGADAAESRFFVAAGATRVDATLTFPGGMGLHDLEVVLLDPTGAEVARSAGDAAPGSGGTQTRALVLDAAALAGATPGEWTARVVREQGLNVEWVLSIGERVA